MISALVLPAHAEISSSLIVADVKMVYIKDRARYR